MAQIELASVENDNLTKIENIAEDAAELLRGLESTARVIHTLGTGDNPNYVDHEDVAHMMGSFREQISTIRDSIEGISDLVTKARNERRGNVKAAK